MLTYSKCIDLCGKRGRKKLAGNTWLIQDDEREVFIVEFWGSPIITIHRDGTYTVSACGHKTVTTKARINEYTPAGIYQKKFQWYFGNGQEFNDNFGGYRITSTGKPLLVPIDLPLPMQENLSENRTNPDCWAVSADWLEENGYSQDAERCRVIYQELSESVCV